tara:strand:- start:237 stop:1043 length:807 start_codon:yes stop_codon:yes gene_type:complete
MRLKNISTKKENINLFNEIDKQRIPEHVAIIMDGNGRWATKKGLPRSFGHNKGVSVLKDIIKVSKNIGCKILTVYAFSTENWTRPSKEVDFLLNLFEKVLKKEINEINQESIIIKFIGDLSPFPKSLKSIINNSEALTQNNKSFRLNICVNYGGRQAIVKVAKEIALKSSLGEIEPSDVNEELFNSELLTQGIKDPELLIRTSGEKRISNFLLWQLAYSEIYITDILWPDFDEIEFLKAIIDYQSRNRRFGGIESLPNESFEDSYYSS